jgi:hypothetical protein
VPPSTASSPNDTQHEIATLTSNRLLYLVRSLPTYFFNVNSPLTLPILGIHFIHQGYNSYNEMLLQVQQIPPQVRNYCLMYKLQTLSSLVGQRDTAACLKRDVTWKKKTHDQLAQIVLSLPMSPLPVAVDDVTPTIVDVEYEFQCIRSSFWLTPHEYFPNTTFLDLFGIATSLLVFAHDKGSRRSQSTAFVSSSSKTPWSKMCKRFYNGLFVTIVCVFEHGPFMDSRKMNSPLDDLQVKHHPYWNYFVPALLHVATGLFTHELFNPFVAWHEDTVNLLIRREKRKISRHGMYSLSGIKQFQNSPLALDKHSWGFLRGGFFPFVRILQCLHESGDRLHRCSPLNLLRITQKEKSDLQEMCPLSIPFGIDFHPFNAPAPSASIDAHVPQQHNTHRVKVVEPLLGAQQQRKVKEGNELFIDGLV